jgi:hypothetical protein
MASINTITVGLNAQPLAPAPLAGAAATVVTVINLDTANTVNLGSSSDQLGLALGPLASLTLNAPVWAGAATAQLQVGIIPGGGAYSPGALTITGPVTATISGPVTVSSITSAVTVSSITAPVDIGTITGSVDINSVSGNVNVNGVGGFIAPGAYSLVLNDTTTHTVTAGSSFTTGVFDMRTFQSYTIAVSGFCSSQGTIGAPLCVPVVVSYYADAAATVLIDTERWWMWLSAGSGSAMPIRGSGPLRGGYVTVTVGNPVGSVSASVTVINLYGAGRSLGGSVWQQKPPTAITSGITMLTSTAPLVPLPGDDKILANESGNTLATTTTNWYPMPLFSGTVSLRFLASAALAHDFIVCSAQGLQNGDVVSGTSAQGIVWNVASAIVEDTALIEVGNCPLFFVISSTGTAPTFNFSAQAV